MFNSRTARAAAKAVRTLQRSLGPESPIERLEPRQLLSAAVALTSDHTLHVAGANSAENISVTLGNGSISVVDNGQKLASFSASNVKAVLINGNGGNDSILVNAGPLPASINGGAGNDTLTGGGGANFLHGGDGDDDLRPGFAPSNDVFGDAGNDIVDYAARTHGFEIHLDGQRDSGMSGEHDLIGTDVENAYGSKGNDIIFGNFNGIKNGLYGLGGNDTLYAGSAPNALYGGDGNDLLNSRDNVADYLDGGAGTDTAHADSSDTLVSVETVLPADAVGGGTIDTSFGISGYLLGYEATNLLGGSLIAASTGQAGSAPAGAISLFTPDGHSHVPFTGQTPPAPRDDTQSDGKRLVLSNGVLTRYNADDSVDRGFGVNGSVSNFGDGNPNHTFQPLGLTVRGMQIYVAGLFSDPTSDAPHNSDIGALMHVTSSGSIDRSFGSDNGIAIDYNQYGQFPQFHPLDLFTVGPDGSIYIAWDNNDEPDLTRYSTAGVKLGGDFAFDSPASNGIKDWMFEPDGKLLLLINPGMGVLSLYRVNVDLTSDRSFGNGGGLQIQAPAPTNPSSFEGIAATLLLRADGEIFVSTSGFDANSPGFTVAFRPDVPAGSGAVSGTLFNDRNSDQAQQATEPGLAFWQVYADLNNNGAFDSGEPTAIADVRGNFAIQGLRPESYVIREVLQSGWSSTVPGGTSPGYHVNVVAGHMATGLRFGNVPANKATATVAGTIFQDLNGDQIQDNGERGLSGWQVFADLNANGVYDSGEPTAISDASGNFRISGLAAGGYIVREVVKPGFVQTTQHGGSPYGLIMEDYLSPGQTQGANNFGNM